jgi:glycine hydroxymethyltransferase
MCVYQALLEPGDTVLGLRLDHGGHLTHGSPVNASGLLYHFVAYGVGAEERIDFDQVRDLAARAPAEDDRRRHHRYPRRLDPEPFRRSPTRSARCSCSTSPTSPGSSPAAPTRTRCRTPTSSPSPRTRRCAVRAAARSSARRSTPRRSTRRCSPAWQGGPLEHAIAGKAIAFFEAAQPSFREYAHQVVANASALAEALAGEGFRLVSGGTDNHLMVVDLRPFDEELTGKQAQSSLDEAGITLNKNTVPDDPRSPFVTSGVRIGTPSVTTQGMTESEMPVIASLIARALRARDDAGALAAIRAEVADLCGKFPAY